MAQQTKTARQKAGDEFTIVQRREVATIVGGMGDLPAPLAAAVEIMADYRRGGSIHTDAEGPSEYEFTIPARLDDGVGRDLDKAITYRITLESEVH